MNIIAKYGSTLALSLMYVSLAFGLVSCVKDRSTLPDATSIPLVEIEVDENKDLTVDFQDKLIVKPKIKASESANLGYRWTLTTTSDPNKVDKETIGEEATLEFVMVREKSSSPYTLTFTVIDKDNDNLEYSTSWNVYVNGSIISGLVIADTDDGLTSNLSYIKSPEVSRAYSGEEKRMIHLLSAEPLTKIPSLVSSLSYSIEGYSIFPHTSRLWAITTDGKLTLFDVDNFKVKNTSDNQSIFLYKSDPSAFKVHNLLVTGSVLSAYTSDGFYTLDPKSRTSQFSLPISVDKVSKPSNGIISGQCITWNKDDVACWFDEEKGAFITLTKADKWGNIFGYGSFNSSSYFDPNMLPNREALAIEIMDSNPILMHALLRSKDSNEYAIYETVLATKDKKGEAVGKYTFDKSDQSILNEAKSFFFAKKGAKVLYVVTATDVFAFTFGGAESVAKRSASLYHLPEGEKEFRLGKLFVQGDYRVCAEYLSMLKPKPAELPLNLQAIILVSSTSDDKNTIRIIPVDKDKLGTGALVTEEKEILSYNGFDKVLDVIHIGQ